MNNNEKKQKIEQIKKSIKTGSKIAGKIGKKILKTTGKAAKETYQKYKKLDKAAKRDLHSGLLVAGGVIGLSGLLYTSKYMPNNQQEALVQSHNPNVDSIMAALTKTYKITDKESFMELYRASLPLIQASMIPTEIFISRGYNDGTDNSANSAGIGMFEFPADGNPSTPEWISTKEYLQKHPDTIVDFGKALALVDWYFSIREENGIQGQRLEAMYQRLKGAEINPHQFTACATCTFNGPKRGYKFCDFVRENYSNPVKCAYYLTTLEPSRKDCRDGILVRHTSEACMFMYPEYAIAVYSFKQKEGINSKGVKYYITSVNQTTPEQCRQVRADLEKNSTKKLAQHRDHIIKYVCKGGQSIIELANTIKDEKTKADFLRYYTGENTATFENTRAEITYDAALKEYNAGNYEKALEGFQKLRAGGYDGADLRNDIAITHYNLGHYKECIEECRAVLQTGEKQEYAKATYNAGKAYEAMGEYENAYKNYERSAIMGEKCHANDTIIKIYKKAIQRTDSIIKSLQPQKKNTVQKAQKNVISKTSPKAHEAGKPITQAKSNSNIQKSRESKRER
ncbi:MAG: tetratricopeptide repeat protein [Alphaproteobacteria bacterium]|nr:tetratricopeptide repeat protein [Alphaproteobacteria bacterium]